MGQVLCEKCRSPNVKIKVFDYKLYNGIRVKCRACGHFYKSTQRWVKARTWKQKGVLIVSQLRVGNIIATYDSKLIHEAGQKKEEGQNE